MFGLKRKDNMTQFLESAQKDRELFALQAQEDRKLFLNKKENTELLYTNEDDKIRAAYALNLCNISISQIIKYNDVFIMDQEYDNIINNLNLEKIIKDEELLNIIKIIMDTITYFKIEDLEKQLIEKQYQDKLKNAIWDSIPNMAVVFTGHANFLSAALSIASMVGMSYMNYRRNKNFANSDKEEKLCKLKESALEQFNGLRRELFSASWRLEDRYNFPDKYRLTEKQIDNYNDILTDTNDLRRYERLFNIRENFYAYPDFWYYLGSAANAVYRDSTLDSETREIYKKLAKEHFEHYESLDKYAVLRENAIASSCCLEHIELLNEDEDKDKIKELLNTAIENSKDAKDVLEICALHYLRIGEYQNAERIMRRLAIEDYNRKVNSQLLSAMYIGEIKNAEDADLVTEAKAKYTSLKKLVEPNVNYMIEYSEDGNIEDEISAYIVKEKQSLQEYWSDILNAYTQKFKIKFYRCFPLEFEYDDDFYTNYNKVKDEFKNYLNYKFEDCISALQHVSFPDNTVYVIEELYNNIINNLYFDDDFKNLLLRELQHRIYSENAKSVCNFIYENYDENNKQQFKNDLQRINFINITNNFFELIRERIAGEIKEVEDFKKLSETEIELDNFNTKNDLKVTQYKVSKAISKVDFHSVIATLSTTKEQETKRNSIEFIKSKEKSIIKDPKKTEIIYFDGTDLNKESTAFRNLPKGSLNKNEIIAIIRQNDRSKQINDFIFTTFGFARFDEKNIIGKMVEKILQKEMKLTSVSFYNDLNYEVKKIKNDTINTENLIFVLNNLKDINHL